MRLPFPALALLLAPLALAEPLAPLPTTTQGEGYAVLIVSRERLEVATTCEVALYLYDQMAARLHQGQSVSFNLPPGKVTLRLGLTGTGPCQDGIAQLKGQALELTAGEVRRYRIAMGSDGLRLHAAPALN
ncbi:hypothetical protein [Ectopseudomonas guguanensis]|jgi:hypothetical protein|uniref:hypothetical protein n=1 Tax=Ectopseudomonas guguanensis TaxID=1198456 RepID=UPI0012D6474C|nr:MULTISPECIES: hypothetical protein [Pseudomonas]MDR8014982.1 hypothetical protein [Pseudomonas guguanensis]MPT16863.1 hypothetical protein [Pseudomonas sp.]WJH55433.1 hypothetical protein FE254_04390 [Pseudomonas guguanensis]